MIDVRHLLRLILVALACAASTSYAQQRTKSPDDYPNKPIRIVTSNTGGSNDVTARLIAQGLSTVLGQQIIVDNRASGFGPGQIASKATPDGYTLLVAGSSLWVQTLLQKTPYDMADFSPITVATSACNILVVLPASSTKSVKELIALAKAKPGMLNYGASPAGTSSHLAAELFKAMAGVSIVHVPYKGGAPTLIGLLGGEVQLAFPSAGAGAPHVKSGKLLALGVTSATPSALFPSLPTIAATVPGYESVTVDAVLAIARTPKAIVNRLNQEIVHLLSRTDVKDKFFSLATEVVASSPQEAAAKIRSDMTQLGKVIKDAGIKAD